MWKSSRRNWPCNPSPATVSLSTLWQLFPEVWLLSDSTGSLRVHVMKHNQGRERTRNWGERISIHACPWWDLGGLCTHRQAGTSFPGLPTPAGHIDGFQELHQDKAMSHQGDAMQVPWAAELSLWCLQECTMCLQPEGKLGQLVQLRQEETFFTSSTNNWQLLVKVTAHDFLLDRSAGATH